MGTDRLLSTFLDLVKIDSLTYQERQVADYIIQRFSRFGIEITEDEAGEALGGNAGNLIARIPGRFPGPLTMMAAHMDTVQPGESIQPQVEDGIVTSFGDTILGADDKAGCAVIIELIERLIESDAMHVPIEAVFTIAEEKGLVGVNKMDIKSLKAERGFVLDGDGAVGRIVIKAPYQDYFKAVFHGKAAHAGVEPERGISAIKAASDAIARMKLGRIDEETTANIGIIEGGRAINIVPDTTVIQGEARSHSLDKLKQQIEHMKSCVEDAGLMSSTPVDITVERLYDGYAFKHDDPLVTETVAAVKAVDVVPELVISGGGSDTNVFNKFGVPTLNISCGSERVHTTEERVAVQDMETALSIMEQLVT